MTATILTLNADVVQLRQEADGAYTVMLPDADGRLREATRLEALLIALTRPALRDRLNVPGLRRTLVASSVGGHAA
jgi:hypothetical protein